jgi:hypothetical protein
MTQTTAPLPQNGALLERHVQTIMLSVITAALIACFTFLWNMNAKIAVMEERDNQRTQSVDQLQRSMNIVQSDMISVKQSLADQHNDRAEDRRRQGK